MEDNSCCDNDFPSAAELPPKPDEPLPSDCCGSGCSPCVFDIYERDLEEWKNECKRIVEEHKIPSNRKLHDDVKDKEVLSFFQFNCFQLLSITSQNVDTAIYKFKLPESEACGLEIGQHLILRSKLDERPITRPYTPISEMNQKGSFNVMIKIYPNGKMSKCISKWKVGDLFEWRGQSTNFKYKANQYRNIVMLAAGTGIAPMVQVIRHVLNNEKDETFLQLIYSCKTSSEILVKSFLDECRQYWNFKVIYCLTQESSEKDKHHFAYGDVVLYQRINEELLSAELPEPSPMSKIFICGTRSFDKDMINLVSKIGFSDGNIFKF